ncbi:MAG: NADP-dependent malic enzyme, partial [Alphaproteobacteria bacterium]|nr:NADP-dependent malic enzyme [Alphaproteobacteria bacterium]
PTKLRTLAEALNQADVFFGLSVKGAVTQEMVKTMAKDPIIFAMANPDPEITPEDVKQIRSDAIIATGRSDYPNQVNNVLGFPYIFRGALDVRASAINDQMKIAAAEALAQLARQDVPDEVDAAYAGRRLRFGPDYIIPVPFDPRLIREIPPAVATAAIASGVAQKTISNMDSYRVELAARLNPTSAMLGLLFERLQNQNMRVVFTEGEEEKMVRAALAFRNAGYGIPILLGREDRIAQTMKAAGLGSIDNLEIQNARISSRNQHYTDMLYKRLQRKGLLYRDCQRMVNLDRNIFAACMVMEGDADAMISGLTRNFSTNLEEITKVIPTQDNKILMGLSVIMSQDKAVFLADTSVHELPSAEELVNIAIQTADKARKLGHEPRVALLSFSNFGNPQGIRAQRIQEAIQILDRKKVDFEYDGEMQADVALDFTLMKKRYPFCRLTGPANILIMPALHSANIASGVLQKFGGKTMIGPLLMGLQKPAQIVQPGSNVSDLVHTAALVALDALDSKEKILASK